MNIYSGELEYKITSYQVKVPVTENGEAALFSIIELHDNGCGDIAPILQIKNIEEGGREYIATTPPRYYFYQKGKWIKDESFCYNRMIYDSMPAEATYSRSICDSLYGKSKMQILKILSESKFPEDCYGLSAQT